MKKLLFIIYIFSVQSFPSYSEINNKGLVCECTFQILAPRDSVQSKKIKHKCNYEHFIYFSDNKVLMKKLALVRDKILIKKIKHSPKWFSNEHSITWTFREERYKQSDFTYFSLSRSNLILEEINHYGKNRLIYYKQCKSFTKTSFYKQLDKLIREHQMKYDKKLQKNKI